MGNASGRTFSWDGGSRAKDKCPLCGSGPELEHQDYLAAQGRLLPVAVILAGSHLAPARLKSRMSAMRMLLPVGRRPATGRSLSVCGGWYSLREGRLLSILTFDESAHLASCMQKA